MHSANRILFFIYLKMRKSPSIYSSMSQEMLKKRVVKTQFIMDEDYDNVVAQPVNKPNNGQKK